MLERVEGGDTTMVFKRRCRRGLLWVVCCSAWIGSAASAEEASVASDEHEVAAAVAAAVMAESGIDPEQAASQESSGWNVVAESELAVLRGGQATDDDVLVNDTALSITVSGNSVGDGVMSGGVSVDGSAFSSSQGIQSTMVNTGHNVSMSSVINLIVNLAP
jgi:hypothetical protein